LATQNVQTILLFRQSGGQALSTNCHIYENQSPNEPVFTSRHMVIVDGTMHLANNAADTTAK